MPAAPRRAGSVAGSRSTPSMRATSSIRSISRVTSSRRRGGTVTSSPSGAGSDAKSSARRISLWRSPETDTPRMPRTRSSRSPITRAGGPSPPMSIVPGTSRAPHSSSISRPATACACMHCSGCRPFSKREEASLRRPRSHEERWMFGPFHVADSSSTRWCPGGPPSGRRPSDRRSRSGPRRPRSEPSRRRACASDRRASPPARRRARGEPSAFRRPPGRGRRRAAAGH